MRVLCSRTEELEEVIVSRKIGPVAAALLVSALVLVGCAAEPVDDTNSQSSDSAAPGTDSTAPAEPEPAPVTQEETCDWDSSRADSGSAKAPTGQSGDIATVLIGAWQHTHIDSGSGYEALAPTTDIRYVFPSTNRMLYCQDVAGATSQAENAVDITLEGTEIVLPSPATGYGVVAWDQNTMVWENHRDGSMYLLTRR